MTGELPIHICPQAVRQPEQSRDSRWAPTSRARRMALDRSETCSLVMMLDAWLCTRLGAGAGSRYRTT
jgi:hypothetical protein